MESGKRKRRVRLTLERPPSASELLGANADHSGKVYWDRSHYDSPQSQMRALAKSSTLYVGNLAFSTETSHLRALFSTIGPVEKIVLGLDRYKKTPCGFAFVEYVKRRHAEEAILCLSGMKIDGRVVRVELDAGFKPGRQYGRGVSGGQVRDDRRKTIDPDRGGRVPSGARWEAPKRPTGSRAYQSSAPQAPSPAVASHDDDRDALAGTKRSREDEGGNGEDDEAEQPPPAKNPRFREDVSDEEMG